MLNLILDDFAKLANKERAIHSQRFFKTGKGEYGEGDLFLGIVVPELRILSKKYSDLTFKDIETLLHSKYHEQRLTALFILILQYKKASVSLESKASKHPQVVKSSSQKDAILTQEKIYDFYLANTKYINNWDLIDLSAPNIVGDYLLNKDKVILYKLAKSKDLWEKRISILATFAFIKNNDLDDTIEISKILLNDKHDLIHKAVGWMLRELGKKNEQLLCRFLDKYKTEMPRTMLRYAIEKFPEKKRKYYLKL